jgi:cyclic-di-GMP-binding protein
MLLEPRETDAWFQSLPMANIGETARRVFKALLEFNRIDLPDQLRAKTVEKFRPPVEYITTNLLKYYIDTGLPLSPKGEKTAALARELQKELAISYKILAQRMISGDNANFDRRLLIVSLNRALHYTGETLLQSALVYGSWPPGIWREINSIYAYASQNNIHQVAVKPDDKAARSASTTIESVFKCLVLFASATPHRLRQGHARLLFSMLPDWVRHTEITDGDHLGSSLGRFNVDLWSDSAPMHNALRAPLPGSRMAVLDVRELLEKLRSDFESAPWYSRSGLGTGKAAITRPMLRMLIMAWSRPPDRRFVRTRLNFDLRVVAGLHAVHGNLTNDESHPFPAARASVFSLDSTPEPSRPQTRKIEWSAGELESATLSPLDEDANDSMMTESILSSSRNSVSTSALTDFAEQTRGSGTGDDPVTKPMTVKTLNESAGGYCIRWKGAQVPKVKIGELIGLESPNDRQVYGLGVVRWMKRAGQQELDIGLEVIATRCQAGDVREVAETSSRKQVPAFKCLIINDTDPAADSGFSASLVMSAMSLQTGVELWLNTGDREQVIVLTKVMEFSSAFVRYQFEFADRSDENVSSGQRVDEFDDLWGNL